MPTTSVSNSFVDIQIRVHTSKRLSVLQVLFSLISMWPALIEQTMKTLQEAWMREDLGPHGTVGNLFGDHALRCPECDSPAVNRKDWKKRHPIVPVLGEIEIPQRRVQCRECESIYRPYEKQLGLPAHKQYTGAALVEGIRNVLVCSYERASSLASSPMSPKTLWRALQQRRPEEPDKDDEYALVVLDATKVPKWKESGQITLTVAHEVSRGPVVYERPRLERSVVATVAGDEEDIKDLLKAPSIQGVMHDGKMNVEPLCELEGRCLWHVPHTVRYLLYKDDIKGDDNKELTQQLAKLVFDDRLVPRQREEKLMKWVRTNNERAPESTTHVQRALEGIRTVEEHPELFEVQTTAPMERRMVELNKRFENGGGWTEQGARALLWHHEVGLMEPEKWLKEVLPNDGPELPEFFRNSLI